MKIEYNEHIATCGAKRKWDIDDVIYEYDQNFNITLRELSGRSGWSVQELKKNIDGRLKPCHTQTF